MVQLVVFHPDQDAVILEELGRYFESLESPQTGNVPDEGIIRDAQCWEDFYHIVSAQSHSIWLIVW